MIKDIEVIRVKKNCGVIENVPGVTLLSREEIQAILSRLSVYTHGNPTLRGVCHKLHIQLARYDGRI